MNDQTVGTAEIDLGGLWKGVHRRLPWILATSLLLGGATYFWSSSKPDLYSASATLISSNGSGQASDSVLGGAIVKAPPLPEGAIPQALQSTQVLQPLMAEIGASVQISQQEKTRLLKNLQEELSAQRLRTVSLISRVEQYSGGNGIYTLTAQARTPQAASAVANLASRALLNWDEGRALQNIRRAESGYRAQLTQIDQQIAERPGAIEQQTLMARRASITNRLAAVTILRDSATGVLSSLSDAIPPLQPDSPRPLRDAVLAGLLGLLLAGGLAALLTLFDRTVRQEDDLTAINLPVLAVVPRIRQRYVVTSGIVRAARQAGLYEAIGFLRVNLLNSLRNQPHPVLMITSTAPNEGKSSITATLADGLASSGQRVLIVDADLSRGTQEEVWTKFNEANEWHQLVGTGGARTLGDALQDPANVQVERVAENIDILPAGQVMQNSLAAFNQVDIRAAFDLWRQYYDIVLVDSAPLLALADGLVLGKQVDGVLLVTEAGQTHVKAVRTALQRAEANGLNILGAVINKANPRDNESYGYTSAYSSRGVKA